jgi:hypothetical protein
MNRAGTPDPPRAAQSAEPAQPKSARRRGGGIQIVRQRGNRPGEAAGKTGKGVIIKMKWSNSQGTSTGGNGASASDPLSRRDIMPGAAIAMCGRVWPRDK